MSASTPPCAAPPSLDPRTHNLDKRADPRPPAAPTVLPLVRKPLNPNHPDYLSSRTQLAQQELMQVDAYLEVLRDRAPSDAVRSAISDALVERHLVTVKLHRLLMAQGMPSEPPGPAPPSAPFRPLRRREGGAPPQPGDYDYAPAPPR